MWTLTSNGGQAITVQREADARHYIAAHYPHATMIGMYAWQYQGQALAIRHF